MLIIADKGFTATFSNVSIISAPEIVDRINQFRANPISFIKNSNLEGINLKNIFNTWADKEVQWLSGKLPYMTNDSCLENIAQQHLEDIVQNQAIFHLDDNVVLDTCDYIFAGGSLVGVAFQNFINFDDIENIGSDYLIKNAILFNDAESVPVIFPYDRAGAAVLSLQLEMSGVKYNVYIIDIVYGVSKLKYNNDVYGKIIGDDVTGMHGTVFNCNNQVVASFYVNPDGSFNILLPNEGNYKFVLESKDGMFLEKDVIYNFGDVIIIDGK